MQKNIENLRLLYSDTSVFNALNGNINDYYLSFDVSIIKLKELLLFQFGEDYENFINFVYYF